MPEDERVGPNVSEHCAQTELIDLLAEMDLHRREGDFSRPEPHTEVGQIAGMYNRVLKTLTAVRADTAKLQQLSAQLVEREAHMSAIVENVAEGVITIDAHGSIESLNSAASRIFGFSPREAIGKNVTILMPSSDAERHDEYMTRTRLVETRILGRTREIQARRRDGSVFPRAN